MPRVFVPTGFDAARVSPDLYRFVLEAFAPETFVLLEFHSLGRQQRQVDMAVLGPYGVDVVEVKAKVGGAVVASVNGAWSIHHPEGRREEIPLNGAMGENPYQQALSTSLDVQRWLEIEFRRPVKVYPLVLIPRHHAASNVRNAGFVWVANGLGRLKSSLRSLRPYKDPPSLNTGDWERIVAKLELTELVRHSDSGVPRLGVSPSQEVGAEPHSVSASEKPALARPRTSNRPEPDSRAKPASSQRLAAWMGAAVVVACALAWALSRAPTAPPQATKPVSASGPTLAPQEALPGVVYAVGSGTSQGSIPDGSTCPGSHPLKGNINASGEKIYHSLGQRYYEVTQPEVCFATPAAAQAEGFRASQR